MCIETNQNEGESLSRNTYSSTTIKLMKLQSLERKLTMLNERDNQLMNQISNVRKTGLENKKTSTETTRLRLEKVKEKSNKISSSERASIENTLKETKAQVEHAKLELDSKMPEMFRQSEQNFQSITK